MLLFKRLAASAAFLIVLAMLSACAESVATPVPVTALEPVQKTTLKITDITDEAAPGVVVPSYDLDRILQRVKAEVSATHPELLNAQGASEGTSATKIKVVITQYDEGNRFARFMLIGLGQIYLDGDVVFLDAASGQEIARYKVSKNFAFGGMYGGITGMEDVEKGFAKSVAAILSENR
jgi:hypothetical protein